METRQLTFSFSFPPPLPSANKTSLSVLRDSGFLPTIGSRAKVKEIKWPLHAGDIRRRSHCSTGNGIVIKIFVAWEFWACPKPLRQGRRCVRRGRCHCDPRRSYAVPRRSHCEYSDGTSCEHHLCLFCGEVRGQLSVCFWLWLYMTHPVCFSLPLASFAENTPRQLFHVNNPLFLHHSFAASLPCPSRLISRSHLSRRLSLFPSPPLASSRD